MVQAHPNNHSNPDSSSQEELERLILEGVSSYESRAAEREPAPQAAQGHDSNNAEEDTEVPPKSGLQGALGLFAEATQDMATAGVELALGRHFACVDYCNQAVEKAAQALSLLRFGRPSRYDHDLRALGELVGAPQEILEEMAILTPFHPEAFYADTPPEEADEVISAERATELMQRARRVMRWARNIILQA